MSPMRTAKMLVSSWMVVILALAGFGFVRTANAQVNNEPPGVARISLIHGDVSMQRGDSGDTSAVTLNTPLVAGDTVFTGDRSRAEVQLDWANLLRLDENTQADIATLERTRIQIQLAQGLANYSVLKGSEADVEINTPNVAIVPLRDGRYRIEVNAAGETLVTVREGQADISTPEGSTRLDKGQLITVRGAGGDVQYQTARAPSTDDFDKWNNDRDRIISRAESWRRTNRYYTGAGDLDAYGKWSRVPDYGWVWAPRVAVGWAPYRHGRWIWQAHWGWTWVSHEPWGWAPYHYGRWFVHGGSWVWWPGPVTHFYRPVWAPAYVSFFGFGKGFSVGVSFGGGFGSIGWLPVGPCDYVYPWWGRQRGNFNVVNVTNITNIYNIRNVNVIAPLRGGVRDSNVRNVLVNNRLRYGLSTVSADNFGRGSAAVRTVSTTELRQGQVMTGNLPVVPTRDSLRASDRPVTSAASRPARLPDGQAQQRFFSRRVPSSQRESFSEQTAQVQQAIERDGRFRPSSDASGNRNAANDAGRSAGRNNNVATLNSPRQNQTAQAPEARREPTAGWRRFGSGQGASAEQQGNARTPVVRAPRQRSSASESPQNGADSPANRSRPAQNETRAPENRSDTPGADRGQPQAALPRLSGRRMAASNPDRLVAQNTGDQNSGNEQPSADKQSGWQRFSGGPRSSSSTRQTNSGNQTNASPSSRPDTRPRLEMNRPIIEQRSLGSQRSSGAPAQAAPRGASPSSNSRVAPNVRSTPNGSSRAVTSGRSNTSSRAATGGRSASSSAARGRVSGGGRVQSPR